MTDKALKPEDLDRLGQAVLTLSQELWVLRDRQATLEALLEQNGLLPTDAIDNHEPDEQLSNKLAAERRQLIDNVIKTLNPSPDSTPED